MPPSTHGWESMCGWRTTASLTVFCLMAERPEMAGSVCSNHRSRRHIADTRPPDINVGYGANSLDNSMSAVSLDPSYKGNRAQLPGH